MTCYILLSKFETPDNFTHSDSPLLRNLKENFHFTIYFVSYNNHFRLSLSSFSSVCLLLFGGPVPTQLQVKNTINICKQQCPPPSHLWNQTQTTRARSIFPVTDPFNFSHSCNFPHFITFPHFSIFRIFVNFPLLLISLRFLDFSPNIWNFPISALSHKSKLAACTHTKYVYYS